MENQDIITVLSEDKCLTDYNHHEIGWEMTKGNPVSRCEGKQIKQVIEKRTKIMSKTSSYNRLIRSRSGSEDQHKLQYWNHSQIELGELLGEGGFNQVYQVNSLPQASFVGGKERDYVVKVLRKEISQSSVEFALSAADIIKEAILMATLDHPHILKTRAVASLGIAGFEIGRPDAFFMIMDKLHESLEDRITNEWKARATQYHLQPKKRKQFWDERLELATQLASAIAYIHEFRIMHRDLKPSNIGFDTSGILKVFDFDMATVLPESSNPNEGFALTARAGSFRYMSPECAKGLPYNLKSDVYSFTLILHQMMSLKQPYSEYDGAEQEIQVFFRRKRPKILHLWPSKLQKLLHNGWSHDFKKRPSMEIMEKALKRLQVPQQVVT